ncbi:DUF6350 family protein [Leucobacter albus]|uniref:DUF6350 family protein n=1 Tax=Leucobacter albus TaxID=272210 RepID=A0ABW3TRH0_9MICO
MRAILTGVVATIEAIAVALATLLVAAAVAFLVWWLAFDLGAEPADVFAGAGAAWLLAHFVPLGVELSPETMQLLGFGPEALAFTLSLAPLGITLVTVGFAARAGWRFGGRGGAGAAGVLGGALGFGAVAGVVASLAPLVRGGWFAAAAAAGLVYGAGSAIAFVIRAAREQHGWWIAALGATEAALAKLGLPRPAAFAYRAGQTLRLAVMLLAGYLGLAGIAFAASLLGRFAHVVGASEALQLDLWGTLLMFVLQLMLLPVLVLWAGSWLTGAGFAVGIGSSASPFGQLLGPLPGLPVLAAIPEGWGSGAVIAPLLLALVGVAIGAALGERARQQTLGALAAQVVGAAVAAGLAIALANWAASGSLGPGRLAEVGPAVWLGAGLAAAELGLGCFLGALAARADVARRIRVGREAGPRLGGVTDPDAGAEALAGAPAGVPGGVRVGERAGTDRGASLDREEAPGEERLAPVARLWPRAARRSGSEAGIGVLGEELDPDDQLTEPLDGVVGGGSAGGADGFAAGGYGTDAYGTDAYDTDAYDTDADDTDAYDTDAFGAGVLGADGPGAPVPEAELFDQHDAGRDDGHDAGHDAGHDDAGGQAERRAPGATGAREAGREPDAEELIEAYSWENVDLDAQADPEPKRQGWRWPGRKG